MNAWQKDSRRRGLLEVCVRVLLLRDRTLRVPLDMLMMKLSEKDRLEARHQAKIRDPLRFIRVTEKNRRNH